MPTTDASPPAAASGVPRPPRRRRVEVARPSFRAGLPAAIAVVCGALVPAIHYGLFPWQVHQLLRDWVMHFAALVAATILTAGLIGYRRSQPRHARPRLAIAIGVPLAITLLHELGQWLWPAGERDTFDSCRDALLNVAGAAVGLLLLRPWRRPGPPA
jgi:hypothetical protein